MKKCYSCKEEKSLDSFGINKSQSDGYSNKCKTCKAAYARGRYRESSDKIRQNIRIHARRRLVMLQEKVRDYLLSHPCIDCNETDIIVLEFDHLGKKEFGISIAIRNHYSWERLLKEIERCDVVCCNCHRRRTIKRMGSWRNTLKIMACS